MYGGNISTKPERHTQICDNQLGNAGHCTTTHADTSLHSPNQANTRTKSTNRAQHNRSQITGGQKNKAKRTRYSTRFKGVKGRPRCRHLTRGAGLYAAPKPAMGLPCPPEPPLTANEPKDQTESMEQQKYGTTTEVHRARREVLGQNCRKGPKLKNGSTTEALTRNGRRATRRRGGTASGTGTMHACGPVIARYMHRSVHA